jgi:hypothetical protein
MTISSTPDQPVSVSSSMSNVKPATPDLILFNEDVIPIEQMTDLIFQDIGGQEILSVARNDIVNGQRILYSPIKNLSNIALIYNSQTIFTFDAGTQSYFQNFAIKFENYTPEPSTGTGTNGEIVYTDDNGNLVINVINMSDSEDVDIQILARATPFNDII